jgi:co-chaperonin GroES (HSP10)
MNKLIVPKHVWDGKAVEKQKKELEKVPNPTGYHIVLFPLKLDQKTKSGILLTDETIQESQLTTNICKVLKVGPDAYKDKRK